MTYNSIPSITIYSFQFNTLTNIVKYAIILIGVSKIKVTCKKLGGNYDVFIEFLRVDCYIS